MSAGVSGKGILLPSPFTQVFFCSPQDRLFKREEESAPAHRIHESAAGGLRKRKASLTFQHPSSQGIPRRDTGFSKARLLSWPNSKGITATQIVAIVADHFKMTSREILDPPRKRISAARKIAMYLCRQVLNIAWKDLATLFSRQESTLKTNVTLFEDRLSETDRKTIKVIRKRIHASVKAENPIPVSTKS